jgi:hypothetical protein
LNAGQNGVLTLPSIPIEDRYQDGSEYACTAGNGIVGRDGKVKHNNKRYVKQTGSGYITIQGMRNTKALRYMY